MNTLQLPRDIEKALQLRHPLTEKYKSEIAEKLSTIMCIPKKNVSCRSKSILRYLNSVYNIKLTQGVGIRTLLINNSVLTSLRVTCYNSRVVSYRLGLQLYSISAQLSTW